MIVVADTSPLNYLVQLHQDTLLPQLFGSVTVPFAVVRELSDPRAPMQIQDWIKSSPSWLKIVPLHGASDSSLFHLDEGEREAIQLALELHADVILIDELEGRRAAIQRRLRTTGILGVIRAAHLAGLIDGRALLEGLLSDTNFRVSAKVRAEFLASLAI